MALNVLGKELIACSMNPKTGFYRNGCCDTGSDDFGIHTVCVELTEKFLKYSKSVGNDLSTPVPEWGFQGLKEGDRWCLCQDRWIQALKANMAPKIILEACHISLVEHVEMEVLKSYALNAPSD